MKKVLLLAAIAVFGLTSVNAQDEQTFGFAEGDLFIEGNVNFSNSNNKNTDVKNNGFGIMPKVGFLLKDDFVIGGQLSITSNKTEVSGTDTSKTSGFGVGAFARCYFLDLGERFKTFTELGIAYNSQNDKIADVKVNTIGAGFDLGINYFVTEKIALSFTLDNLLSFSSSKADVTGAETVNSFSIGAGSINNPFGGTANFGVLFKL